MFCRMLGMIGHFPSLRNVGSGHPVRKRGRPVLVFGQSSLGLREGKFGYNARELTIRKISETFECPMTEKTAYTDFKPFTHM